MVINPENYMSVVCEWMWRCGVKYPLQQGLGPGPGGPGGVVVVHKGLHSDLKDFLWYVPAFPRVLDVISTLVSATDTSNSLLQSMAKTSATTVNPNPQKQHTFSSSQPFTMCKYSQIQWRIKWVSNSVKGLQYPDLCLQLIEVSISEWFPEQWHLFLSCVTKVTKQWDIPLLTLIASLR